MTVSLSKGGSVSLSKTGQQYCIGVNWGSIVKSGWFGKNEVQDVDLDLSLGLFSNGACKETVYYGHKLAKGVKHYGDDLTGDADGDDGMDNETISVDLSKLDSSIDTVLFVINSFDGTKFGKIPYIGIRVYSGTPENVGTIHATFESQSFKGGTQSSALASLRKIDGEWVFKALNIESSSRDKASVLTAENAAQ